VSLDVVRESFREATIASSLLGEERHRIARTRAEQDPLRTMDGKPKLRWPTEEERRAMSHIGATPLPVTRRGSDAPKSVPTGRGGGAF
jgi:hypothetical protein